MARRKNSDWKKILLGIVGVIGIPSVIWSASFYLGLIPCKNSLMANDNGIWRVYCEYEEVNYTLQPGQDGFRRSREEAYGFVKVHELIDNYKIQLFYYCQNISTSFYVTIEIPQADVMDMVSCQNIDVIYAHKALSENINITFRNTTNYQRKFEWFPIVR